MSRKMLIRLSLPLAWLAAATCAAAAPTTCAVPHMQPAHRALYGDHDGSARLDDHYRMDDPAQAAFIDAAVSRHPHNERLRLGRGSAYALMGRRAAAERDFRVAIKDHPGHAHDHWSYGWALFNLGEDGCALAQWRRAAALAGGHPYWLPYAAAESYWRLGRQRLALQWFAAAVRSQPSRWGSEASIRASTYGRNWSDAQRSMLIDMLHAWQAHQGEPVASTTAPHNPAGR